MAGILSHPPAHVIRKLLVDLGLATEPSSNLSWPAFTGVEPDLPDECITVTDTSGRNLGVLMAGEVQETHGFQVRVRSLRQDSGYVKARTINITLDAVDTRTVAVGSRVYLIKNIYRPGDVLYLGQNKPQSSRFIHTVNGLTHLRQIS